MPIRRCLGDSYDRNAYYQEYPGTPQSYDIYTTEGKYNGGGIVDFTPPMLTYETILMVSGCALVAAAVSMFFEIVSWNQDMSDGL